MHIAIGRMVGGTAILDKAHWEEGALVAVVARDCSANRPFLSLVRVAAGKMAGGKVTVSGAPLEEGAFVAVLATDAYARLSSGEKITLHLSVADADGRAMISAKVLLVRLAQRRGR